MTRVFKEYRHDVGQTFCIEMFLIKKRGKIVFFKCKKVVEI